MNKELEYYYQNPALNQSKLKKLLGYAPNNFFSEEEQTQSLTMGDMVDCLITRPLEYNETYYVSELTELPSENIVAICKAYFNEASETDSYPFENRKLLVEIAKERFNYQTRWKDETLCNDITVKGTKYYNELAKAKNRYVISKEQDEKARAIAASITLTFSEVFNNPDIEYQKALYSVAAGDIPVKGLLDCVIVDNWKRTVDIYEIKTMWDNTAYFISNLHKYRYDIQMAWYKMLCETNYPNYDIKCHFIVESVENPGTPVMYTCDDALLEIGKNGIYRKSNELYFNLGNENNAQNFVIDRGESFIEGYIQLLAKYRYYETNGYSSDIRIRKNENRLTIGWNGSKELM